MCRTRSRPATGGYSRVSVLRRTGLGGGSKVAAGEVELAAPGERRVTAITCQWLGTGRGSASACWSYSARAATISRVPLRPVADGRREVARTDAELGQRVLHTERHRGIDPAADQAVAFERTQCLGEHLLRHAVQDSPQLVEPARPAAQCGQHIQRPFVGEHLEDSAARAVCRKKRGGTHEVPRYQTGA